MSEKNPKATFLITFRKNIYNGENSETHYMEDEAEQRWLYDSIIGWSPVNAITIDDNGTVTPAEEPEIKEQ